MHKLTRFIWLAVLFSGSLASCTAVSTGTPIPLTSTAIPPTVTETPESIIATPLPTQPRFPDYVLTPNAIQVTRWKEYQAKLASCVLGQSKCYDEPFTDALCEWDILGRSGQEIYVWAMCLYNTQAEKPLVVYLQPDGSILKMTFGGYDGPYYNLALFPVDIQKKIDLYLGGPGYSSRVKELGMHLAWRLEHPDKPPLIVLSATPQP